MANQLESLILEFEIELKKAWIYRDEQAIANAKTAFLRLHEILAAIQTYPADTVWAQDAQARCKLLECALLRADGDFALASQVLAQAKKLMSPLTQLHCFELNFQKAIHDQVEGQFAAALQQYGLAKEKATTSRQKLTAEINILTCLESLGELTAESLDQFEATWNASAGLQSEAIHQQLRVMKMRLLIWQGKPESAQEISKRDADKAGLQEKVLREFLRGLPFHAGYVANNLARLECLARTVREEPHFFKGGYRYRTLTGESTIEDLKTYRVSEFADRLYLWTWRILAGDEDVPILDHLAHFDFAGRFREQSAEDFQLIQNALLWLSLFDEKAVDFPLKSLRSFSPRFNQDIPIFCLERDVIEWIRADISGQKTRADSLRQKLLSDPLWKNADELLFREILNYRDEKAKVSVGFRHLVARLRMQADRTTQSALVIEVNPALAQIRVIPPLNVKKKKPLTIRSEAMAAALLAFKQMPALRCEHFAEICFGIRKYDEFNHKPKIFNLISRLRSLFRGITDVKFGVKEGVVYARGLDRLGWGELRVANARINDDFRWIRFMSLLRHPVPKLPSQDKMGQQLATVLKTGSVFKRLDVEKTLNVSRATAHRLICAWISAGALSPVGRVRYRAKNAEKELYV